MGQEIATTLSAEEPALVAGSAEGLDRNDLVVPVLKLCQGLTEEVGDGLASPGDFLNNLTGENHGDEIEFIVSHSQKGRARRNTPNKGDYDFTTSPTVPWDDDPFYGQPFTEHPEAEEKYSAAVNSDPDKEWGDGPTISTTYSFTGYVIGSDVPTRLTLQRTTKPAAKKINTILSFRPAPWDTVLKLASDQVEKGGNRFSVINARISRPPTPEERESAIKLASAIQSDRAQFEEPAVDVPGGSAADVPTGGLDV